MKDVIFSEHALFKIELLKQHNVVEVVCWAEKQIK